MSKNGGSGEAKLLSIKSMDMYRVSQKKGKSSNMLISWEPNIGLSNGAGGDKEWAGADWWL